MSVIHAKSENSKVTEKRGADLLFILILTRCEFALPGIMYLLGTKIDLFK